MKVLSIQRRAVLYLLVAAIAALGILLQLAGHAPASHGAKSLIGIRQELTGNRVLVHSKAPIESYPGTLSENEIGILMDEPAQYVRRFYGMSFYRGRLYVSTYVGLLEIVQSQLSKIYKIKGDGHSSAPWTDMAHHLLWTLDAETRKLVRFDGTTWSPVNEPRVGWDFSVWLGGNANGFWMIGARWDSVNARWERTEIPPRDVPYNEPFGVIGVLPIRSTPLMIVRHWGPHRGYLKPVSTESDTIAIFNDEWHIIRPARGSEFFARSFTTARDIGYICAHDGTMLQISVKQITKLDAPGPCEIISTNSEGNLVVSIPTKGIFQFDGGWVKLADHPHPINAGKYQAYLAMDGREIAYAAVVEDLPGFHPTDGVESWGPITQLWITQDGQFRLVRLRK
jgi:hypothetical protein